MCSDTSFADAKVPHAQGKPCWLDYYAEDQGAAIAFYRELFGWTGEPNAQFGGYAMMEVSGHTVAGISPRMPDQPPMPPAWNVYFAVNDVDATAEQIGKLGGTKFVGPDEVPGTGKFVFAADPAGAAFGLWQPGPFPGFGGEGEHGMQCWFELETNQGAPSAEFYGRCSASRRRGRRRWKATGSSRSAASRPPGSGTSRRA